MLAIAGVAGANLTGEAAKPAAQNEAGDPVLARVFPSIVRIEAIRLRPNDGRFAKQWSGGSGVIFSKEGHVLTNCHVTEEGDYFRCYLYDGAQVEARLVGQDAMTDLAVLQLDLAGAAAKGIKLSVCQFGDSDRLSAGSTVFALGSPGFLSQSVTRGIVANPSMILPEQTAGKMMLRGEDVGMLVRWILHDAQIFHGNSGGPLVNDKGEIVGINEIGVFSLSGAIPGNLAKNVAAQLVATGVVVRGWSGITVQSRLETDGSTAGVMISDVEHASPAAKAGLQPGDLVLACDGKVIEGDKEKAVAQFNRLETSRMPGDAFAVEILRGGQKKHLDMTLERRASAQSDNIELPAWGAIMRDLTPVMVRNESLPDAKGVWLENIRPAGPCGQAEPELRRGDVIVSVEGAAVDNSAALKAVTEKLMGQAPTRTVAVGIFRDGAVISSVVELRTNDPRNITPQVRKAWLGVQTQPLMPKLARKLGIKAEGGARVTRVFQDTEAERAGLRVGDVILSLDGVAITARRSEDVEMLARQVRQYKVGTQASVSVWRDGQVLALDIKMQQQPVPPAELPWWDNRSLEFVARDIAFDDRVRLQLAKEVSGVLVEAAAPAGWAALSGLRTDDIVLVAGDTPVTTVDELKRSFESAVAAGKAGWVLLVQRRNRNLFVEIKLKNKG